MKDEDLTYWYVQGKWEAYSWYIANIVERGLKQNAEK